MRDPVISVILPVRNAAATLSRCLSSLASQSFDDFEVVVVDGASTDATLRIAAEFAARMAQLRLFSERDSGVYDALNKGIAQARGRWVYVIGGDDMLADDDVLRRVVDAAEPGSEVLHGQVLRLDKGIVEGGSFTPQTLFHRNICQQAIFYRRDLFQRLGGFDLRYPVYADWAFNLHCLGAGCATQPLDLTVCRYEGAGLSSRTIDQLFLDEMLGVIAAAYGVGCTDPLFTPHRWAFLKRAETFSSRGERARALKFRLLFWFHALRAAAARR